MTSTVTIRKTNQKLKGSITLPASKSISNRLLMIRAYSGEEFKISNLSAADDTNIFQQLLKEIISAQSIVPNRSLRWLSLSKPSKRPFHETPKRPFHEDEGATGRQDDELTGRRGDGAIVLDCHNAGTAYRFLLPYLAISAGEWILTGSDRMKQRPIAPLVDALRQVGADIDYLEEPGFPPLRIHGQDLQGGTVSLDSSSSSQFSSALMMMGAFLPGGLVIELRGKPVSQPYTKMTAKLLSHFGITAVMKNNVIHVAHQGFSPADIVCEPDWSSASYWYEMACLADESEVLLKDLHFTGLQGDEAIAGLFYRLGVQSEDHADGMILRKTKRESDHFAFDFSHNPDLAMTLAATVAGLGISAELNGLQNLVIKESNRLEALYQELKKAGCTLTASADALLISASSLQHPSTAISTYSDHRMAMAFAPLALVFGEITIQDPGVVVKSYPHYWTDLQSMAFELDFCE